MKKLLNSARNMMSAAIAAISSIGMGSALLASTMLVPTAPAAAQVYTCYAPYFSGPVDGVPRCVRFWQQNAPCNPYTEVFFTFYDGRWGCWAK